MFMSIIVTIPKFVPTRRSCRAQKVPRLDLGLVTIPRHKTPRISPTDRDPPTDDEIDHPPGPQLSPLRLPIEPIALDPDLAARIPYGQPTFGIQLGRLFPVLRFCQCLVRQRP